MDLANAGSSFEQVLETFNLPDMVQVVLRLVKFVLGVALIFR